MTGVKAALHTSGRAGGLGVARAWRGALLGALALGACSLLGCAVAGPSAISNGRMVYNDVITRTNSEQLLALIVRLRYGEPFGLLTVASVTANLKLGGSVGAEFGLGPDSNYAGNLVPLSVGATYEENPTISYVPLSGEAVMTRLLAPLPLKVLVPLLRSANNLEDGVLLLVSRMNGLRRAHDVAAVAPPEFVRAAELMGRLRRTNMLDFGLSAEDHSRLVLVLYGFHGKADAEVEELLSLLDIEAVPEVEGALFIPIRFGVVRQSKAELILETPDLLSLIRRMGFGVEVPADHLERGIVFFAGTEGLPSSGLVVRTSRSRPTTAAVATRYRDHWFYIDESDIPSKLRFMQLLVIVGMRLSGPTGGEGGAPVLTIPVGG